MTATARRGSPPTRQRPPVQSGGRQSTALLQARQAKTENITANADNSTLSGGGGADVILGGDGDDSINGQGATDTLAGNQGVDTITDPASEINEAFTLDDLLLRALEAI